MRIMQIGHSHRDYLNSFARRFKRLSSHAELMQAYINDYYWCCHTYIATLQNMGHDVFLCLPTDRFSQQIWCQEHGLSMDESGVVAMRAQVEWFKPDILYVSSPGMFHDAVLEHLTWRPPFIVGWHATITQPHMRFSHYDLILSSHEECLYMAREQGAQHTAVAYPGIPAELADSFTQHKRTDICFSGYWAVSHLRRNQFLYELAQRVPALGLDCAYYLGFYPDGPECPRQVQNYNRGAVWGQSMFKAFAASRIVLNGYASINFGPQNLSPNMRQLEVMGVGSFLLTEQSDNLAAFFTAGKDLVTYASTDELVEKAVHYVQHEDEREAIAAHGLATCRRYYNMDVRTTALLDAVERVQQAASAPTLEEMQKAVHLACTAYAGDAGMAQRADLRQLMAQALECAREHMLAGKVDRGLALFNSLKALPIQGLKQACLCQALGAVQQGDRPLATQLLRQELDEYPENDAARHCLSRLALHKKLWD